LGQIQFFSVADGAVWRPIAEDSKKRGKRAQIEVRAGIGEAIRVQKPESVTGELTSIYGFVLNGLLGADAVSLATSTQVRLLPEKSILHNHKYFALCFGEKRPQPSIGVRVCGAAAGCKSTKHE
jgi:hypothetical protein